MRSGLLLLLCSGSVFLGVSQAQTAPPAAVAPTIRTTASEVLLDIVVRDKHGKPVRNLKPVDVQIFEDGVRRDLKSFRFVAARAAETARPGTPAAKSAPSAPSTRSLRAVNLICLVLHNLDPASRPRAIEAVQEFLKNELPPDTFVGLFLLDDAIAPVFPFTKDRAELSRAAADAFRLHPLDFGRASEAVLSSDPMQVIVDTVTDPVAHTSNTTIRIAGGQVSKTIVTSADVNTSAGANIMRGAQARERRDFAELTGMRATDQIVTMVDRLGPLPGRKSVLLVTTGLLTTGDPDRFDAILTKATRSDLTVYAMDVAGLSHISTSQAADLALGNVAGVSRTQTEIGGSLSAAKEKSRQGDTVNQAVRASDTQSALRDLSEGTGGFIIANTNEFRKPFQRIVEELEAHYEASYQPSSGASDGALRRIEVKLARPELRAESRTGYFAMPDLAGAKPLAPHEVLGLAVLSAKPRPHAFDFHTGVFEFRDRSQMLVFQLPGASLAAAPAAGRGVHLMHASLLSLVKDATGQVIDEYSVDAPYEAPDANLNAIQAASFTYTHPLTLTPGHYSAETAVIDRQGGRASSTVQAFDVPEAHAGVSMSSVVLVQSIEDAGTGAGVSDPLIVNKKRLIPFLGAALKTEAKPYAYFVVYPELLSQDAPKLRVEFRAGDALLADQTSDLPKPDATGAIPMIIRAANHAGDCELRITAIQGGRSTTRAIHYTVAQ
jgi:VWFA-related protein